MSDFDFFKDENPIKNNMVMDLSRFFECKEQIKELSPFGSRSCLYEVFICKGYEIESYKTMVAFLKELHPSCWSAYNKSLESARTEVLLWGESGIGKLDDKTASLLKSIGHDITIFNRLEKLMKINGVEWSFNNVYQAMCKICNISEAKEKQKALRKKKEGLNKKERAIKYFEALSPEDKREVFRILIRDKTQQEISIGLDKLIRTKARMVAIMNTCHDALEQHYQFILDPTICNEDVFRFFGYIDDI